MKTISHAVNTTPLTNGDNAEAFTCPEQSGSCPAANPPRKRARQRYTRANIPVERVSYTTRETCEMLGVSRKTLQRLMQRKLIHSLTVLRTHLFTRKEIERFLNEGSNKTIIKQLLNGMNDTDSNSQINSITDGATAAATCPPAEPSLPPNLLPLDRPLESSKSDKLLPFKDAGRNFNARNIEVAMLSALLNDESVAKNFAALLDAEDFYNLKNKTIFAAFLYLWSQRCVVSRESLECYLAETVRNFDKKWQNHIDWCMATPFNENDIGGYVVTLKEAAEIRGTDGYCRWTFLESFYAARLVANLPPAKCIGKVWFQYKDGIWSTKDTHMVRKTAFESIHPNQRQAKRVADVIELAESSLQVPSGTFTLSAYRFSEGGVLINAANGVISVSNDGMVKLEPHAEDYYFTAKLNAAYDSKAQCPTFEQTVSEALPDLWDRDLLQRFAGCILLPSCQYEVALIFYGLGGTGKSTISECFLYVLGESLSGAAGLEELCKSGSYSLPELKHKMLNLGSELCSTEIGGPPPSRSWFRARSHRCGKSMDARRRCGHSVSFCS